MFGTNNLQIYDQAVSNNKMNLVERIKENVLNNYNYNAKHSFKWTNNFVYNTALYSGEDRKSTFYTDPNSVANDEVIFPKLFSITKSYSHVYCLPLVIVLTCVIFRNSKNSFLILEMFFDIIYYSYLCVLSNRKISD